MCGGCWASCMKLQSALHSIWCFELKNVFCDGNIICRPIPISCLYLQCRDYSKTRPLPWLQDPFQNHVFTVTVVARSGISCTHFKWRSKSYLLVISTSLPTSYFPLPHLPLLPLSLLFPFLFTAFFPPGPSHHRHIAILTAANGCSAVLHQAPAHPEGTDCRFWCGICHNGGLTWLDQN